MTPKAYVRPDAPTLFSTTVAPSEAAEQGHTPKTALSAPELEGAPRQQVVSRGMSLFEIDESLSVLMESAAEAAAESNGEIPAELQQALLDYCEAFGQKVDNLAWYIRSQEFEAKNAKAEIERLEQRKAVAEHGAGRLKEILKFFMQSRNIRSMKGALNTISLLQNCQNSLVLSDLSRLSAEFWRVAVVLDLGGWQELLSHLPLDHAFRARFENPQVVTREPDNASIRAALAAGTVLEGAELWRGAHIRIK
jgi:hypothetical protein